MAMNSTEIISCIALFISFVSLGLSAFFGLRDRARIITKSVFIPNDYSGQAYITISVVNAGRRPIILRMWGGAGADNDWVGTFLGDKDNGLRLAEHERHEFVLHESDLTQQMPDFSIEIKDVWFEDTLGRRYTVKDAKKNIAKLVSLPGNMT